MSMMVGAVAAVVLTLVPFGASPADVANAASAPSAAGDPSLPPDVLAQLDAALDQGFQASGMPGVTVGLWIPGYGEWVATRGVSNLDTNEPMNRANQSKIGSVTKTMTTTI